MTSTSRSHTTLQIALRGTAGAAVALSMIATAGAAHASQPAPAAQVRLASGAPFTPSRAGSTGPQVGPRSIAGSAALPFANCEASGPSASDNAIATRLAPQINTPRLSGITGYQVSCARAIVAATQALKLDQRAAVIAVTTAMTESTLHDYTASDNLDSLGLYQQRASEGWGTPAQEENPADASDMFLDRMQADFPTTWNLSSTDIGSICQGVQRSGDPGAYDPEAAAAALVVNALWSAPSSPVAGRVSSRQAVAIRSNGQTVVVAPEASGQLVEYVSAAGSTTWSSHVIPGAVGSYPSLTIAPSGQIDVVYVGAGSTQLWHVWNAPGSTSWGIEKVTGAFGSDPVSVVRSNGELDVAYVGAGSTQIWYSSHLPGKSWTGQKVTGAAGSGLTAGVTPSGRFDLAYVGAGGTQLWHVSNTAGTWAIGKIPNAFGSDPVLLDRSSGETDIAYVGAGSTQIWYAYDLPGKAWAGEKVTGAFGSDLGTTASAAGSFDVSYIGAGGTQLWHASNTSGSGAWALGKLTGGFGNNLASTIGATGQTDITYVGAGSHQLWLGHQLPSSTWTAEKVTGASSVPTS
ncbi:hypothetical protein [Rudaeicoccus suwonensis]|uniref:Uncharacterized protein n=1 Tax=Rudaeicoccus suwonensis TaxID=657409 RepID=A0A561E9R2_9MICO|nr:hypothetical protein [Rudaeicoccus suwonensis]TWE12320.1 hypothetical protein BKA23_1121 [Rudaeicoccus suwonensis]